MNTFEGKNMNKPLTDIGGMILALLMTGLALIILIHIDRATTQQTAEIKSACTETRK